MKRTILFILVAVFMMTQLFAGGGRDTRAANDALDVMMWTRDIADFANMVFYRQLEEQTGIPINLNAVHGSEWGIRTNLMFASGDYPDIILRGSIEVERFGVDQRILIPLDNIIERNMPNYSALLSRDPSINDLVRASDGNVYYTIMHMPQNISVGPVLYINNMWLNQLDLPMPATFTQFENTLRAFRDRIPNSIPFSGIWGGNESLFYFLSFWGIPFRNNDNWIHITDDHRVVSQLQDPNLRSAMETLNRWYDERLIDIEVLTQDLNAYHAKLDAGRIGTVWRWRMMAMGTQENIVEQFIDILPFSAVSGVTPVIHRFIELPSPGAYITTGARDVERAARWIDAHYTFENMLNGYFGPYQEVIVDGNIMKYGWELDNYGKVDFYAGDLQTNPNLSALFFYSGPEYFERFNVPPHRIEKMNHSQMYENAGVVERNSASILSDLLIMSPAEMDLRDLLSAQIDTFARESLTNFVTRGVTDASWNTFNTTLQNLRMDEYIRMHQQAYDRYRSARR